MRTLNSTTITEINNTAKWVAYLCEIDTPAGSTLYYAQSHTDIVFNSVTYIAKNFDFPEGPHNAALDYGDTPILLANEGGVPANLIVTADYRGYGARVKGIFLSTAMTPIGTDYLDIVDGIIEDTESTREITTLSVRSRLCVLEKSFPVMNFGSTCPWVFGGAECTVVIASTAITAATADAGCTATVIQDAARTEAADYWKDGVLTFTSGANNGVVGRVLTSAVGSLTLEHALASAPAAGDTYNLTRGCDKQYATCDTRFSNTANFRGFVNLPREMVKE